MIDGTEKPKIPSLFAKHAAQYNQFGCNVFIITEQTYSKVDACNNFFHVTINFRNRHTAEGEEEEFEDDDEDDTVDYSKSLPFNF